MMTPGCRSAGLVMLFALAFCGPLRSEAMAQSPADFAGEWQSPNAAGAMAAVRIVQERGRWVAHGFGSCTPKPCDWGTTPFTVLQARPRGQSVAVATWQRGSSTRFMTFRLGEGNLHLEIYNLFSGLRDQPSYFMTQELTRPLRTSPRSTNRGAKP